MIVLLTDFGQSEYVGMMKGVIYGICAEAQVVDLYHGVEAQNVREGAWILQQSYRYFPAGTIFLCVVDPQVGTSRRAVVIAAKQYFFVGPDNGLMWPAASADGIEKVAIIAIPDEASRTFHGRDVFAPAAARLEMGEDLFAGQQEEVHLTELHFSLKDRQGEVVRIDHFGNIITNLTHIDRQSYQLQWKSVERVIPFYETYAQAKADELFVIKGSGETLELSVNGGKAIEKLPVQVGDRMTIKEN
ncbi:MAG: SAM-dependent chlorinase/fluorinase [Planctomycetes bacterium]|nr:SAM-dependent chlorinase/fluorinase [Planctomycetota bacterium]